MYQSRFALWRGKKKKHEYTVGESKSQKIFGTASRLPASRQTPAEIAAGLLRKKLLLENYIFVFLIQI